MPAAPLILASASPRRRELLENLGLTIEIVPSAYPEPPVPGSTPRRLALLHAVEKAKDVAQRRPDAIVIGADTVVDIDGDALGKPRDAKEAVTMLTRLRGRRHEVHTGFALIAHGEIRAECATAGVEFYALSDAEIAAYVATGDPLDKAGAYGIQGRGAVNIRAVYGDFYTVVGLPVAQVYRALLTIPSFSERG